MTQQPINNSFPMQSLTVRVPIDTEWDPVNIEQFMTTLFAIPGSMILSIIATGERIVWQISASHQQIAAIINAIYSFYPLANINQETAVTNPNTNFQTYSYEMSEPFVRPLKFATDFSQVDPLTSLITAQSNLQEEEMLVYELVLAHVNEQHIKLGRQLLTRPRSGFLDFITPQGAFGAVVDKAMGFDRIQRFYPELQKLARHKLATLLKVGDLSIKVKARTSHAANELAQTIEPALAPYAREGSNYLLPASKKTYPLILSPQEGAALWHLPNNQMQVIPKMMWTNSAEGSLPSALQGKREHIQIGKNVFRNKEQGVWLSDADRHEHVIVLGKTGTGKSNLMEYMIQQDIAMGNGVGVIDPHGDLYKEILNNGIPKERAADVVLFDMEDKEYPIALNLLASVEGVARQEVAGQSLSVIRKMFADQWSSTRMEDSFYAALIALLSVKEATIESIPRLFMNSDYRAEVLQHVSDPIALAYWLDEYETMPAKLKYEFARPIASRIRRFYRDETIRHIICQQSSLNFRHIMDEKTIFLANLGGLPEIETEIMGALLISKFQTAAMSRNQLAPNARIAFYLYIDEVQRFITTSLDTVFSEARKYGLRMVVANQYLRQLTGETLEAIMGNTGTTIMFGLGTHDATAMAPFVHPQFGSETLLNLNRFQTLVKMRLEGKTMPAFNMDTLPALALPAEIRASSGQIRARSRAKYARPRAEVEQEFLERQQSRIASEPDDVEGKDDVYAG